MQSQLDDWRLRLARTRQEHDRQDMERAELEHELRAKADAEMQAPEKLQEEFQQKALATMPISFGAVEARAQAAADKAQREKDEHTWHEAARKFQQDWDQARQKAEADMKSIKSTADSMAGEVSGVLNSALTGKLNWAQEVSKIGQQMVRCFQKQCHSPWPRAGWDVGPGRSPVRAMPNEHTHTALRIASLFFCRALCVW